MAMRLRYDIRSNASVLTLGSSKGAIGRERERDFGLVPPLMDVCWYSVHVHENESTGSSKRPHAEWTCTTECFGVGPVLPSQSPYGGAGSDRQGRNASVGCVQVGLRLRIIFRARVTMRAGIRDPRCLGFSWYTSRQVRLLCTLYPVLRPLTTGQGLN